MLELMEFISAMNTDKDDPNWKNFGIFFSSITANFQVSFNNNRFVDVLKKIGDKAMIPDFVTDSIGRGE